MKKYRNGTNKLILLDYDGTLTDFYPVPEKAIPSENLLTILTRIISKPQTKVVIISGRPHRDIDKFLGYLPIDIVAEHGAMAKENGEWKKQINDIGLWKKEILHIMNQITLTCPKSFIEEKHFSLTWHYRNAEPELGYTHSRKLIHLLENIIPDSDLKILDGNKVVEIVSKEVGKGIAVKKIVEQSNYDYILAIGDDVTDEEMFAFLADNDNAVTIKVGQGDTLAKHRLETVEQVLLLLEQL